jgi:hypothetical protein
MRGDNSYVESFDYFEFLIFETFDSHYPRLRLLRDYLGLTRVQPSFDLCFRHWKQRPQICHNWGNGDLERKKGLAAVSKSNGDTIRCPMLLG